MKNIIKNIIKICRDIIYFPFMLLAVINFLLRETFFGFDNACNYLRKLDARALVVILRLRGAQIGKNCDFGTGLVLHNCKSFKNLSVGDNCHIGKDCFIDLRSKVSIGNGVVVSMRSSIITHIDMTKSELSKFYPAESGQVKLGDNAYIGSGTTILMNCEIEQSAFIASNSLVNTNIPSLTLWAGVPAKKRKAF